MHKAKGFTLIEVLIALLILAIVLLGVGAASYSAIRTTSRLRQHMVATWVAENVLTKMQLGELQVGAVSDLSQQSVAMNGRTWYWSAQVGAAVFGNLVPVTVSVATSETATPIVQQTANVVNE